MKLKDPLVPRFPSFLENIDRILATVRFILSVVVSKNIAIPYKKIFSESDGHGTFMHGNVYTYVCVYICVSVYVCTYYVCYVHDTTTNMITTTTTY